MSGEGLIRFRKIDSDDIIEYRVSGEKLQVVDIPVGYTHSIVNVGENDLVTVMWVNECFDSENQILIFGGIVNEKLKVMTVVGTRPEIIRLSAVINKLEESKAIEHILVHTGQNYDYELNEVFLMTLN